MSACLSEDSGAKDAPGALGGVTSFAHDLTKDDMKPCPASTCYE